jgi:GT2 family glycosyltransferase
LWAARPDIGVTGAKLLRPNGKIQHAGVVIGLTGFAGHLFADEPEGLGSMIGFAEWYRDVSAVTGACQIFRRGVFESLGGYDEQFEQNGSDVAICLKALEKNLRVVVNPFARLAHAEHASVQSRIPPGDFAASLNAYAPRLKNGDPFFNPNLSYWHTQPALSQPDEPSPWNFARDHAEKLHLGRNKA